MLNEASQGVLSGIRVIDFGRHIAGAGVAMMLADQGADVIRVEDPMTVEQQGPLEAVLNRGKRSVVLDLKTDQGRAAAQSLIATADVVIENFRPGVMDRLGVGARSMREANPGLVYLSLPGFSKDDIEHAGIPAWEGVISAAMGQFTDMGLNRVLMGSEANYSPLTLASAYGSAMGAAAVVFALRAKAKSGIGDHIEVPLAAALMEGLAYNSLVFDDVPARYLSLREREAQRRRAANLPMDLSYEQLQDLLDPFYRSYVCEDGRPVYLVSLSHTSHPVRALKILGVWDEIVAQGVPMVDPYTSSKEWPDGVDCSLFAYPITQPWAKIITQAIKRAFLTKDSFEWERLLGEGAAPAAAHRTTKEWIASAHAQEAGLVIPVDDARYGTMLQPGPAAWLEKFPPVAGSKPASPFGADTNEVLREIASKSALRDVATASKDGKNGPWLEGITVVDLTNVIAGPTIGGTLARFGARVIKVDAVKPTYDPWNTIFVGVYNNQSKESVLLDIKSDDGKKVLTDLVAIADVITINAPSKQLPALGLDFDTISAINPRAVLCHLDAYGGIKQGPRSNHAGYDDTVQASTGIMERFGGSFETVEEHAHFGTIDVLGGFFGCFAVALGLLNREKTGRGDVARTSLATAGQWLQARFLFDFPGRPAFNEPRGRDAKGEHAFYRCYRAEDGWFFLAAPSAIAERIRGYELFSALPVDERQQEEWLSAVFAKEPIKFWHDYLKHEDVAVTRLATLGELRDRYMNSDPQQNTVTFRRDEAHPCGRGVSYIQPTAIRSESSTICRLTPNEKYGESTRRILGQLGYADGEIEEFHRRGTVASSWSEQFLPD